jgi:hypothetical protein
MKIRLFVVAACLTVFLCTGLSAQDQTIFAPATKSKLVNFPGLPTCMKGSVQNGDPSKGPSVILGKGLAAGSFISCGGKKRTSTSSPLLESPWNLDWIMCLPHNRSDCLTRYMLDGIATIAELGRSGSSRFRSPAHNTAGSATASTANALRCAALSG